MHLFKAHASTSLDTSVKSVPRPHAAFPSPPRSLGPSHSALLRRDVTALRPAAAAGGASGRQDAVGVAGGVMQARAGSGRRPGGSGGAERGGDGGRRRRPAMSGGSA